MAKYGTYSNFLNNNGIDYKTFSNYSPAEKQGLYNSYTNLNQPQTQPQTQGFDYMNAGLGAGNLYLGYRGLRNAEKTFKLGKQQWNNQKQWYNDEVNRKKAFRTELKGI